MIWSYASHIPPAASLFAQAAQIIDRVFSPPPFRSKGSSKPLSVQSVRQKSSRCTWLSTPQTLRRSLRLGLWLDLTGFHLITFEKLAGSRSTVAVPSSLFSLDPLSPRLLSIFSSSLLLCLSLAREIPRNIVLIPNDEISTTGNMPFRMCLHLGVHVVSQSEVMKF